MVKDGDGVLHRRGGEPPYNYQEDGGAEHRPGEQQHRAGPKAVHRAQGEEKQALPVQGAAGPPGVAHLQQEAQKAVKEKIPEPLHPASS